MSINVSASLIGCPLWTTVNFKWYSLADSGGLHSHFSLWMEESSPAQSTGPPSLDSTPIFTLEKSSPAESGGLHRTPLSGLHSHFHSGKVQSSRVRRTPPDTPLWTPLPFSLWKSPVQQSPADSTGPPSLDSTPIFTLEKSSPAKSGGLHRTPLSGLHSHFHSGKVQSSTVQRTPPDTPLWTTVNFYSGGLQRSPADPLCDDL
jgi:hypothetical protein